MNKKTTLVAVFLLIAVKLFSQGTNDGIEYNDTKFQKKNSSGINQLSKSNQAYKEEANIIQFESQFETIKWENQDLNFIPSGYGEFAGDINGDGLSDLVRTYFSIFNVKTENLSDRVNRSLIFYGGDTNNMLPDDIVDSFLYPAGDMNNDGFDDAIGVNFDSLISFYGGSANGYQESGELQIKLNNEVIGFYDFNNDGFEDILAVEKRDGTISKYTIVYGGSVSSEFQQVNYETTRESVFIRPVRQGDSDLLFEFWLDESSNFEYAAREFKGENKEVTTRFMGSYDFSNILIEDNRFDIQIANLSRDKLEDVLIIPAPFSQEDFNNIVITNSPNGLQNEFLSLSTKDKWIPMGDFNNDGLDDFISFNSGNVVDLGLTFIGSQIEINSLGFLYKNLTNLPRSSRGTPYFFGDLNGDGFDDIQLPIANEEGSGNRILYGNDSLFFENTEDVIYPNNDFQPLVRFLDSRTLPDLNGDGINDLAMLYLDHMDIFLGGDFSTTPNHTITFEEGTNGVEMGAGDFTGDGFTDIAISISVNRNGQRNREVLMYFGSENFDDTVDHRISSSNSFINNMFAWSVAGIGDFNADGIEDFAIMTFGVGNVYMYFGGQTLSTMPNQIINLNSSFDFNNIDNFGFSFGYRFNGVGDINGDGIDDLTVSDLARNIKSDDGTETANRAGVVFVIYGSDFPRDNPPVIEPNEVLFQKELALEENFHDFGWSVKGMDFNGDGENDLIIVPRESGLKENETIGLDAVFVYYGGNDFDNIADQSFPIPSAPFGREGENLGFISGELIIIPDLDGDGSEELMIGTDFANRNAALFLGGESNSFEVDVIYESPNQINSLGVNDAFINLQFQSSVGDFDNDGRLEIILPQSDDRNFRNTPLYIFPLNDPNKEVQTITFDQIENKSTFDEAFELIATASSELPVTFEVIEGPATISGSTLSLNGTEGMVTVRATQAGDDNFTAAEPVEQTFEVQIITHVKQNINGEIIAFPNPVTDQVSIQSGLFVSGSPENIKIWSLSGKLIQSIYDYDHSGEILAFSLSNIENGIYLIEIQSASERSVIRVLKN